MTEKPTEDNVVPIREISRQTGVNTVTLRAWERRYGLLKPMRTDKGHRLYSRDDIQRVKDIQSWLARGLAISKVKAILTKETPQATEAAIDSVWLEYANRLDTAVGEMNRRALDVLLNELVALYPAELIADQVLGPALDRLQVTEQYSTRTKLAFLGSVVLEQFYFGHNRQRQTARGPKVLLLKLAADDSDLLPLILNYSLMVNGLQATYLGHIPAAELIYAAEKTEARAVVVHGDSNMNTNALQQNCAQWRASLDLPLFLTGRISRVFPLDGEESPHTADSMQAAVAAITETLGN